jgi:hypothetical protein
MRKAAAVVAGIGLFAAIALAAADIPTRYSGSFPSIGRLSNVTGTFSGNALVLKATIVRRGRFIPASGRSTCTRVSSTQTRCVGTYRADDGEFDNRRMRFVVTWSGGRPVAISHGGGGG